MMDPSNEMNKSQDLFYFETPASILVFNSNMLITLMVLNILISITATTGNMLVLLTIWRSPHLHSPSNTLVFGLGALLRGYRNPA